MYKKAIVASLMLIVVQAGCGVDDRATGTIVSTCTGEEVGYITDDGTHVFYSGLTFTPSQFEYVDRIPDELKSCSANGNPPPEPVDKLQPQDTGTGSYSSYDTTTHQNGVTCQKIIETWCWNGSCSTRIIVQCGDKIENVIEVVRQ